MKFKDINDINLFLLEMSQTNLVGKVKEDYVPTDELMGLFIKSRSSIIPKLKNFRKSQSAKSSWRQNRYNYMKGIKSFHKSTRGKRFHRNLGRFLSLRGESLETNTPYIPEIIECLKALSSLKTHLLIEMDYFHTPEEEVDLQVIYEEAVVQISECEKILMSAGSLTEDHKEFLLTFIDPDTIIDHCKRVNISSDLVEDYFISLNKFNKLESPIND